MCLNCGCGRPDERHGSDANIVMDDIRRAGEVNGQDVATTVANLQKSLEQLRKRNLDRERGPVIATR